MKLPDIFKKLKRNNTGELVCQIPEAEVMDDETPCLQGVSTTKNHLDLMVITFYSKN